MRRPSTALLGVLALALLAGCAGLADSGDSTATPGAGSTPTLTPAPVAPADATAENTVAYDDLGPVARAAFEDARADGARFLPETPHVDGEFYDPNGFEAYAGHDYVVRNGTHYEIEVGHGTMYAQYDVRAVLTDVDPANATHVDELPANASRFVRTAIENRSATTDLGESLPDGLDGVRYVHRNGSVFELRIAIADYAAQRVSLERVE